MKDKSYDTVTIGFVGHCNILSLFDIKKAVEKIPNFDLIFFKTTSGKLWIKESDIHE